MPSLTIIPVILSFLLFLFVYPTSIAAAFNYTTPTTISDPWNTGARCVNITSFSSDSLLSCKSFLTYDSIYVDDLQPDREAIWRAAQLFFVADDTCIFAISRLMCVMTFRPCEQALEPVTQQTITLGGYPCRSLCEDQAERCLDLVQLFFGIGYDQAQQVLSCDEVNNTLFYGTPSVDIYPPANWTTTLDAANITGNASASHNLTVGPYQCYDANRYLLGAKVPIKCAGEGFTVDSSKESCNLVCPQPLLTRDEYHDIETLMSVLSWLSAFACFLTIFLILCFGRSHMQAPSLALVFCVGMEASAGCFGSVIGHEEVWCDSEGQPNTFGDPECTIQGIVNVYFELASIMLWFVIILDIFLNLLVKSASPGLDYKQLLKLEKEVKIWGHPVPLVFSSITFCFVFFPMTLPLIPVIISLGAEKLGYDGSTLWCTIHSGSTVKFVSTPGEGIDIESQSTGNPWNMALATGPSVILVLIGLSLLMCIFIYVFVRTPGTHQRFVAILRLILDQWRLMLFVFVFALYYLIYLAFSIEFEVVKDAQYQDYLDYIECSVQALISCVTGNQGACTASGCKIEGEISYPFWVVVVLGKWGKGMALLPIFGISRATIARIISRTKSSLSSSEDSGSKTTGLRRITGRVITAISGITQSLEEVPRSESTMLDEIDETEHDGGQVVSATDSSIDSESTTDEDNEEEH